MPLKKKMQARKNSYLVKKAAVVPSRGIGDALLMMIASHRLLRAGYQVTTYHSPLTELGEWFPGHALTPLPDKAAWQEIFGDYDLILLESDNSPACKTLRALFPASIVFYPSYLPHKHGALGPLDQPFDGSKSMADNIAGAITRVIASHEISKNNGLLPPSYLIYRKHPKRVVIHPTSSLPSKNWSAHQFIRLAALLKQNGFEPVFAVSPAERAQWEQNTIAPAPLFSSLATLAEYVYESSYVIGNDSLLGHLASNLHIPSLIIANCKKRMQLWRPGWYGGSIVTPPRWIPNIKFLRWREKRWQMWISPQKVLLAFQELSRSF